MRSAADGAPSFVHVPGLAEPGDEIAIAGDEAHYLRRVVRVRAGESVTATDGAGTLAELVVLEPGEAVRVRVSARRSVPRGRSLELWCGAPEGERADWLVEKLGELGVATLRPVDTARGSWEVAARRAARWERLAVAAMRQSRSAYRLAILPPVDLAEALGVPLPWGPALVADPAGGAFPSAEMALAERALAAVGPSGGFSDDELKRLSDSGFVQIRLGATRLRTETAALATATLILAGAG